ncbi:MAG TPA: outer membrane protein assembly factor BamD [Methylibium sp.]
MSQFRLEFGGQRLRTIAATLATAALLGACGTTKDEFAGQSNEKLYADAREEVANGNYEKGAKIYEKLKGRAAGTLMAQQAELELAWTYYKSQEKAQALSTIESFIKLHPSSPALDYALYLQGLINFNDDLGLFGRIAGQDLSERDQQASRDAYQSYKQLVDQFPESKYAPDARLRMNYIVNTLAAYEVHVARYYYRRGAYVAAANRAQQAVQEFSSAPAVEEALYIMMLSYDRLDLPKLHDDAQRVLTKNFPTSRFLSEGFQRPNKPWWQLW